MNQCEGDVTNVCENDAIADVMTESWLTNRRQCAACINAAVMPGYCGDFFVSYDNGGYAKRVDGVTSAVLKMTVKEFNNA